MMDIILLFKDALKHNAMHYNSLFIFYTESSGVPRHQQNARRVEKNLDF